MSLKPVKKSDRGKSWMQPRRDSKRTIQPEYHLIITEGTKTEPLYFEALKERINARFPNRIHMDIVGKGKVQNFSLTKLLNASETTPMDTAMYGWYMTQTTFQRIRLTTPLSAANRSVPPRQSIMHCGPTNVSNSGSFCISATSTQTLTGKHMQKNSQSIYYGSRKVYIRRIEKIFSKFFCPT